MRPCYCEHWEPGGNYGYCNLADSYVPESVFYWCPVSHPDNVSEEIKRKKQQEDDDYWDDD
jgi:hypothetical protein